MASTSHTHGSAPPHEHENAAPGHTHDAAGTVSGPAAATEHRHPGIGSHEHGDARPGHTHDEERRVRERPGGGMAGRIIFGLVGAAGMLVGPFLPWLSGEAGTAVQLRALFSTEAGGGAGFAASAGFVVLVLGAIALIGLLFRSGWLTSLAAGLGLAVTILVAISRLRAGDFGSLGLGWWIAAVGSLLALIASMFATRTRVVETRDRRT